MKSIIQKSQKNKRILIIAILVLILAIGISSALVAYAYLKDNSTSNVTESPEDNSIPPDTEDQNDAAATIKENSINADQNTDNTQQANLELTITSSPVQASSSTQVRVSIDNAVLTSGTCTLSLSKGGFEKSFTSDIQALASSSACKNFNVPANDLGSSPHGTWAIEIQVLSGNRTGKINSKIEIEK